jgi:hypothetical protein
MITAISLAYYLFVAFLDLSLLGSMIALALSIAFLPKE